MHRPDHGTDSGTRSPQGSAARTVAAALAGALLAVLLAACSVNDTATGADFEPRKPDTLVVATANPSAPALWRKGKDGRYRGFEADLARELATGLGLPRVEVVTVPFAEIVDGRLGDADLAISQVTPTDERAKQVSFSTPYLRAPPGVLARKGVEAEDAAGLKELRWLITEPSTLTPIVEDSIRPDRGPRLVRDRAAALSVLRAGQADAYLVDLPVALGLARDEPDEFDVLGHLPGDEALAAVLPKGSANVDAVDAQIRRLEADGTIDRLADRWLGSTADDVPLIRVKQ